MCEPVIQQKDVALLPSPDFLLLMIQLAFGELISVTPIWLNFPILQQSIIHYTGNLILLML